MTILHIRSAQFELLDDGRTLEGCIVPYNEVADVVEFDAESNSMVRYQETFMPHSLAAMSQGFAARGGRFANGQFIPLLIDHHDTFDNMVGHAVKLEDRDDGAYAAFRLYEDSRIEKIRSVLKESHTGLSISFRDVRAPKIVNDIVQRIQVFIAHVAATPSPAYQGAGITAMRSSDEMETVTPLLNGVKEWLASQRPVIDVG